MSIFVLALLALASSGSAGAWGAVTGAVSGRVVDPEGRPVAAIGVYLGPAEGIQLRRRRVAATDEDGRFSFEVPAGRYGLNAYDESRGYLNSYFSVNGFGQDRAYVVLEVVAGETAAGVLIETTPVAGSLEILVVDDQTGEPIIGAGLEVAVAEAVERFRSHGAGHVDGIAVERRIPSEVDLRLTVSAAGYQDLVLEEQGSPRVRFAQGERRSIVVRLQRAPGG